MGFNVEIRHVNPGCPMSRKASWWLYVTCHRPLRPTNSLAEGRLPIGLTRAPFAPHRTRSLVISYTVLIHYYAGYSPQLCRGRSEQSPTTTVLFLWDKEEGVITLSKC